MRNKRVLTSILAFLLCGFVYAAEPYASIAYAEGSSFILVRNNKTTTWLVSSVDVFGMEIFAGDIIQTGPSTMLEVAIHPISASIQIAENTSFRCDADSSGTKSSGELYYGRVRAKVAKLTGSSSYRISSPSLVAGVRGTDFGCDVIAVRPTGASAGAVGSLILHRVFCFEGSVLVGEAVGDAMNTILIADNEMVEKIVTVAKPGETPVVQELQKKPIAEEVETFWEERPFVEESPEAEKVALVEEKTVDGLRVTERNLPPGRDNEPNVRNKRVPNTAAIILISLGSASVIGAGIYSGQVDSGSPMIAPLQSAGLVMISSGLVLALISALVK